MTWATYLLIVSANPSALSADSWSFVSALLLNGVGVSARLIIGVSLLVAGESVEVLSACLPVLGSGTLLAASSSAASGASQALGTASLAGVVLLDNVIKTH